MACSSLAGPIAVERPAINGAPPETRCQANHRCGSGRPTWRERSPILQQNRGREGVNALDPPRTGQPSSADRRPPPRGGRRAPPTARCCLRDPPDFGLSAYRPGAREDHPPWPQGQTATQQAAQIHSSSSGISETRPVSVPGSTPFRQPALLRSHSNQPLLGQVPPDYHRIGARSPLSSAAGMCSGTASQHLRQFCPQTA